MTRPADNKEWTDLVAGYVLGNLDDEEMQRLEAQLQENPELSKEILAFQETLALLPYDLPLAEPSAALKEQLLVTASKTASAPTAAAPQSTHHLTVLPGAKPAVPSAKPAAKVYGWPRWVTGLSTSVAALAIAAFGITYLNLNQQKQQTTALKQQLDDSTAEIASLRNQLKETETVTAFLGESATQVHSLVSTDTDSDTLFTGRLLAKAGNREIVFVAQDLPQLPSEQIYRLWAVADEFSGPMYCGQFRQDASGTARWTAPDAACTNTPSQLLITLDAPDDPITSAGPLVLQSDV